MNIFVRPTAHGFLATSGEPLPASVEAPTRQEAVAQIQAQMSHLLQQGGEIVRVTVSSGAEEMPAPHPWMAFAGDMKDNPLMDAWEAGIQAYRAERDAEENPGG